MDMKKEEVLIHSEWRGCRSCQLQQRITTVVCICTCIFAFSCCAYCTWIIRTSYCDNSKKEVDEVIEFARAPNPSRVELQAQQEEKFMLYKRTKRSETSEKDHKKKRQGKKSKTRTKAAHYKAEVTAHFINKRVPGYVDSEIIDTCADVDALDGRLCRDGRFTPKHDNLKIFTKAPWVNRKRSPFKQLKNGVFEASHNGIYLVYGQLLTLDNGDGRSVTITQTRISKGTSEEVQNIMCYEGYQDSNKANRFKTCGIMALFSVKKKDQFIIQDYSKISKLDLRKGSNFFGAVVLK